MQAALIGHDGTDRSLRARAGAGQSIRRGRRPAAGAGALLPARSRQGAPAPQGAARQGAVGGNDAVVRSRRPDVADRVSEHGELAAGGRGEPAPLRVRAGDGAAEGCVSLPAPLAAAVAPHPRAGRGDAKVGNYILYSLAGLLVGALVLGSF